jgi:starch phosphorylase
MSSTLPKQYKHPYTFDKKYKTSVAYFSMEFAIDQSFKIYSGGLGFLAGSHMRSAFDLKQNMIGIGVLWKQGYYDQILKEDRSMGVMFQEKIFHFLEDTGIRFTIEINNHPVWIKALFLNPTTFGTAPMFFLSTDLPENDYLAQSTTFRLYDSDPNAKVAQCMVLGVGGAKLLDELNYQPDLYHFNEAHALSGAFHLYKKFGHKLDELKKRLVFTTHTPEEAGNEKHDIYFLQNLSFFCGLPMEEVSAISGIYDNTFNHTLVGLRFSHKANGVSKLHGEVSRHMWEGYAGVCPITHITNAQNKNFWADPFLEEARVANIPAGILKRKARLKHKLFDVVADQTGKLFKDDVLTIVWARRFAEYKRPDLITRDHDRFRRLMENKEFPIQLIFAGKPYPMDYGAINTFNSLAYLSRSFDNMAVLTGYELKLSRQLKEGSDVWLNTPRVTREASGTSGMSAAMNGSINLSTNDGWICEFYDNGVNSFVLPTVDHHLPTYEQDAKDLDNLLTLLENVVVPMYYKKRKDWNRIMIESMNTVVPFFDSARMVDEYYEKMYS